MPHYTYLIVGGGMTADAAVEGIRESDSQGSIGLISEESDPPYNRPPLTKGLWKGEKLESIWRKPAKTNAELHLGRRVVALDLWRRQITDREGDRYTFDKLLLATGGRPRLLPFGNEHIIYFRTARDYRRLRELAQKGKRFAVIGGGFIGSEIAAALKMNDKEVVLLFPASVICERMFPRELGDFITKYYREKGVEVLAGERAAGLERHSDSFVLKTTSARELTVDGVIAGLGIEPNVELAQSAGIRVEEGIVVDEFLRTSHPDIYAAGDVAAFYNPALRRRLRVEHEDNANTMGKLAGQNMAGLPQRYRHLPFFYSDLFDFGYEAVGETDSRLATVADWEEPMKKGTVYYHRDGQIRGVLLWNIFGQVDAARRLIAERRQFRPEDMATGHLLKAA